MAALANGSTKYSNSLICCSPRNEDEHSKSPSSSTSGCVSADDSYASNCIPKSIGNKKLKIHSSATKEDIEKAITQSTELILSSAQCSDERKWLVRYLIELRLRLEDLKDNDGQPRLGVSIKGHHFKQQVNVNNRKQQCDHCSGLIWNIVQGSYLCNDCGYLCHYKCVDHICRVCAHVVITEKGEFEMSICPEKGLAAQDYKCAECHTALTFGDSWNEPRLCDYTGLYFCATCHWYDRSAIPARVVHNWDWDKRYVSRLAYQMLTISWDRPYIDIEAINPKLFGFSPDMDWVHIMRKNLEWMRRYLCACSEGSSLITPLFMQLGDVNKKYSMSHLQDVYEATDSRLAKLIEVCRSHITNCPLCSGKGYLCEICGNNEILFPFDMGAILCEKCNTMSHRNCFRLKGDFCRKCQRIESKKSQKETPSDEQVDGATEFDIDRFVE